MIIQGQVGSTSQSVTTGANPPIRQGQLGDVIVSELHGRYYETTYRRAGYSASILPVGTANGVTTSAGTTTTFTGLVVYNPPVSGVNLVINKASQQYIAVFSANSVVGWQIGYGGAAISGTSITNVVQTSNFAGQPVGYGIAYNAATLPTAPVLNRVVAYANTTVVLNNLPVLDFEGSVIVPPGGYIATYTSAASAANGMMASISWEEVPV
jgi:hypothetical protein